MNTFTFKIPVPLIPLLERHRFPGENDHALTVRMLERLARVESPPGRIAPAVQPDGRLYLYASDLATTLATYPNASQMTRKILFSDDDGQRCVYDGQQWRPLAWKQTINTSDIVTELVARYPRGSKQESLELLIELAVQLPRMRSLQNADEAMGLLRQFTQDRILVSEAIKMLTQHSAEETAKKWLYQLHLAQKIKLITGLKNKVRFGQFDKVFSEFIFLDLDNNE